MTLWDFLAWLGAGVAGWQVRAIYPRVRFALSLKLDPIRRSSLCESCGDPAHGFKLCVECFVEEAEARTKHRRR